MTPANNRRLSYSLRALFVLVTLVASLVGWWTYHANWIRERRAALERLAMSRPKGDELRSTAYAFHNESRPGLPWSLRMLGERPTKFIFVRVHFGKDAIDELQILFPEAQIAERPPFDDYQGARPLPETLNERKLFWMQHELTRLDPWLIFRGNPDPD